MSVGALLELENVTCQWEHCRNLGMLHVSESIAGPWKCYMSVGSLQKLSNVTCQWEHCINLKMLNVSGSIAGTWKCYMSVGALLELGNVTCQWEHCRNLGMLHVSGSIAGTWECYMSVGGLQELRNITCHWEHCWNLRMLHVSGSISGIWECYMLNPESICNCPHEISAFALEALLPCPLSQTCSLSHRQDILTLFPSRWTKVRGFTYEEYDSSIILSASISPTCSCTILRSENGMGLLLGT
jgi:hypothetical protein